MIGPPGSGKSMLAQRLPGLLPPLSPAEALEVSMIHSVAGLLADGRLSRRRPFRDPHHSASLPALVGGGLRARPGEISLAHLGVLFLDELPEFARATLEALRQPLETGRAVVARANAHLLSGARPARRGDEPVPLRLSRRSEPGLRPRPALRPGLSVAHFRPALRSHRSACRRARRHTGRSRLPPPSETSATVAARVAARARDPDRALRRPPRRAPPAHQRRARRQIPRTSRVA